VQPTLSNDRSRIVLASASPRRQALLSLLGLPFTIQTPNVDEYQRPGESPSDLVLRLSLSKTRSAVSGPESLVIAADTIVVLDGQVLGKPPSPEAAVEMLTRLRGRQHIVHTGLTLVAGERSQPRSALATTIVQMRDYSDGEIRRYVNTAEPMDKAGSYAIQSETLDPVARIQGCYANVMGLPLCHLYCLLDAIQRTPPVHPLHCCPLAVSQGCPWSRPILRQAI